MGLTGWFSEAGGAAECKDKKPRLPLAVFPYFMIGSELVRSAYRLQARAIEEGDGGPKLVAVEKHDHAARIILG